MIRGFLISEPAKVLDVEPGDPILRRVDFVAIAPQETRDADNVQWLAMLLRQGMLLVVAGIERRYGIKSKDR